MDVIFSGIIGYVGSSALLFLFLVSTELEYFYYPNASQPNLMIVDYSRLIDAIKGYMEFFGRPDMNELARNWLLTSFGVFIFFQPNMPKVTFHVDYFNEQIDKWRNHIELRTRYYYRKVAYKTLFLLVLLFVWLLVFFSENWKIHFVVYFVNIIIVYLYSYIISTGELIVIKLEDYLDNRNTSFGKKSLSTALNKLNKRKGRFIKQDLISNILIKIYAYDKFDLDYHIPALNKLCDSINLGNSQLTKTAWSELAKVTIKKDQEVDLVDLFIDPKIPTRRRVFDFIVNKWILLIPLAQPVIKEILRLIREAVFKP